MRSRSRATAWISISRARASKRGRFVAATAPAAGHRQHEVEGGDGGAQAAVEPSAGAG